MGKFNIKSCEDINELDNGPDRKVFERMCAVSRKVMPVSQLVRFVLAPDGVLTPDIKRRLPGRGLWVEAQRTQIEAAIKRKAFTKGLKTAVEVPGNLCDLIDNLLEQTALQAFSLANKAGKVVFGQTKVESEIAGGKVIAVFHAVDAAPDSVRKVRQALKRRLGDDKNHSLCVSVLFPFQSLQMSLCLGREHVIHTCLINDPASKQCLEKCETLIRYRGQPTIQAAEPVLDENFG